MPQCVLSKVTSSKFQWHHAPHLEAVPGLDRVERSQVYCHDLDHATLFSPRSTQLSLVSIEYLKRGLIALAYEMLRYEEDSSSVSKELLAKFETTTVDITLLAIGIVVRITHAQRLYSNHTYMQKLTRLLKVSPSCLS